MSYALRSLRAVAPVAIGSALCIAGSAEAYIGPGSGLAALGTLLALIGAAVMAVFGFIWFPIKRMLKKRSKRQSDAGSAASQ